MNGGVRTSAGWVRGTRASGVVAFLGIPYAAPPVGPLRFRSPQPPSPWPGTLNAVDRGPIAVQHPVVLPGGSPPIQGQYDIDAPQREDCLRLHVWTPEPDSSARPVLVWIHPGGFSSGSGFGPWTDGAALARAEDLVVVSLNHRLGVFGHLALDSVVPGALGTANAGLLDIVAALHWVRDEIERFGGDPSRVTLFGESGGGWKISTLLAMPEARGLFHGAVIQSGSYLRAKELESAELSTRRLLSELGISESDAARIEEVPARSILEASRRVGLEDRRGTVFPDGTFSWNFPFAPTVDNVTLFGHPFHPAASAEAAGVALLVGTTTNEWTPFYSDPLTADDPVQEAIDLGMDAETARATVALYRERMPGADDHEVGGVMQADLLFFMPAVRQLERASRVGTSVYSYLFGWRWSLAGNRAMHSVDIPLVFGNLGAELLGTAGRDDGTRLLSMRMGAAWASFARSGDPNVPGLPAWPVYSESNRATMLLDHECRVELDVNHDLRVLLS